MKEASSTPQPPTPASRASFSLATVLYYTAIILLGNIQVWRHQEVPATSLGKYDT